MVFIVESAEPGQHFSEMAGKRQQMTLVASGVV
jgi:hypothetical protein